MKSFTRLFVITFICAALALAAGTAQAAVVINEIHYHPSDDGVEPPNDPEGLQFIELFNTGPGSVDLSGWSFSQGVNFIFPAGTTLAAGGFIVVADDPALLRATVPGIPVGVLVLQLTAGSDLSNSGDWLQLVDTGSNVVDDVTFDDVAPWPPAADGSGPTLELMNPGYDNAYAVVWKASAGINGTPGQVNSSFTEGPTVLWEDPTRNSVVPDLSQVEVMFAESVTGVVAADLTVAGSPATSVSGSGAGPYVFTGFATPTLPSISVVLGPGAIQDLEAHAFSGDTWLYSISVPRVVINEIHYNPDYTNDLTEFIELVNAEAVPVDISGWNLTEFSSPGVVFPAGTILQPGEFIVAAKDPATLATVHGCVTSHTWGLDDSLANAGEPISLRDASGVLVDRVYFDDGNGWPPAADGDGPSLERKNPLVGDACIATGQSACAWQAPAWAASLAAGGTCGAANSVFSGAPTIIAEVPTRDSVIESLTQVSVTFSEPVTGVTADDLSVEGVSATGVTGSGAGPYVFTVTPPVPGTLDVVLRGDGGIQSLTAVPFAGDSWLYFNGLPKVVINEIFYHPSSASVTLGQNPEDLQFLELYNDDVQTIDLGGFRTSGVTHTFPAGTLLDPGEYLVLAENPAVLQTKVTIPVGVTVLQWTSGDLANGGETLELSDSYGHVLDSVPYDDGGEWAPAADGDGPSLELVNPGMPNQYGGAWRPSLAALGTPGAANGRYFAAALPVISAVHHAPPIPGAGQPVTITAFVVDAGTPTVTLQYRQDQEPTVAYTPVTMFDDGLHGDGAAGDHVYGVVLSGLAEDQRLDFAIRASNASGAMVAPVGHDGNFPGAGSHPAQVFLCKFSSAALPADFPSYHMITTQYTRNRQGTRDKTEYDATFLRCPAGGPATACEVFYNVVENYRGASSLNQNPPSYRIDLPGDHAMASEMGFTIRAINMLGQQPARQGLGYSLFKDVGLPAPRSHFVRFNTNPLAHGGTQNCMYSNVERIDEDFFTSQDGSIQPLRFPERCSVSGTVCERDRDCPAGEDCVATDDGNCYRGRHDDSSLRWEGFDKNAYRVDGNERNGYQKVTNEDDDDWTDLITLCDAMNCSTSDGGNLCLENTYDGWFQQNLPSYADVAQWARWDAIHMLLDNVEGGIYRDTGDDYFLYFWPAPDYSHATFLPWDLDAILPNTHETIWRTGYSNANWPLRRVLRNNAYAGLFVGAICEYMDTVFTQEAMNARIDALPDVLFPTGTAQGSGPQTKQGMKDWVAAHRASVNAEIKRQTTLQGVPASPYESEDPVILLSGQLNQCWAKEVRVNGQPATYTIANPGGVGASWTYNFTLVPGPNTIIVQTLDHQGNEIDRATESVTYAPPGTGQDKFLKLTMPSRMVSDKTFTLKAEVIDAAGRIAWQTWSELGTVSARRVADQVAVPLTVTVFERYNAGTGANGPPTTDSIRFYNGVGTVSFTFNDPASVADQDVEITVTTSSVSESKVIHVLGNVSGIYRNLSGTLSGDGLTWGPGDGVIHLTGTVTVPGGSTLTILPGTLIMAEPGASGDGTRIDVSGVVNAPGTEGEPIFFFPSTGAAGLTLPDHNVANPSSWRGFLYHGSGTSTLSHVFITGAGNAPVVSHPRPMVMGIENSHSVTLLDCVFADNGGKLIHMTGSGTITLRRTVWSRAGYGGEFLGGSHTLLAEDCWFTRIGRAPESNDADGDVMHLDNASAHQTVRRSIFADCGDDMIDHSGANPVVEDTIFWDGDDKTVSLSAGGSITFDNVLVFGMPIGINGAGGIVRNSTITAGMPMGTPTSVDETIIWSSGVNTGSCNGNINYTDAGSTAHLGCGTGNLNVNPQFESTASLAWDYDPAVGSSVLTAGPTGGRIGWLGFPDGAICSTAADCDDANACTVNTCVQGACVFDAITGCEPCQGAEDCDDGDPCNVDGCDAGACTHVIGNNGVICNDGQSCTINDMCSAGACVGTESCPPGQACSPTSGMCVSGPQAITFRQGVDEYAGTQDTYLYQYGPNTVEGGLDTWRWDTSDGATGYYEYGLIRFDEIIGAGADQIPQGSTINSATLTLEVFNGGATPQGTVREVAVEWSQATATWNNFGGEAGVQADEYGALVGNAPIASGTVTVDVTASLQRWVTNPAANLGWIFVPASDDGVQVRSAEYATVTNRPLLSVTFTAPVTTCTTDEECDDGLYCNGVESCDDVASVCVPGDAVGCGFTFACAINTCNETTDTCDHAPNDAFCDDGDACNGAETCSLLAGCLPGTPPSCDDGIACTTDSCVSPDGCQHVDSCPGGQTCNHTTGVCTTGPVTMTFQQGDANGYLGTVDTYIDSALGSQATVTPIVCDGSPVEQILVRFDGLFGNGAHQIPQGATVNSATLTLHVGTGANDQCANPVNYHRLLQPWEATDVWATFGAVPWNTTAGVQNDGVDALAAIDATVTMTTANTAYPVTVTATVQAWANDPATNHGWVILPTSNDGLRLDSSEATTLSARPLLSITYTAPVTSCTTSEQCNDGLFCNGTETCNLGTQLCEAGTPPDCADSVACTLDACNETSDACEHVPDNTACDDSNVCTDNVCNVTLGCTFPDNTAPCSDGNACTTGDVCAGGSCQAGTTPLVCDDGLACTNDSCAPASGCQFLDNCTGGQTCNHTTGTCTTGPVTMTFQQGDANAYAGTADTYIGSGLASMATTNPLVIDLDPTVEQVLIRFDGIFGSGANQVPQGATIDSATLTMRVGGTTYDESPNPVNFHRLLHPWADTGLWADYGVAPWNATAGIQADGVDALAAIDATTTMSALNTSYPVDVTTSVQAWSSDPASNYGWAILMASGTDGLRLQSAESATLAYRPLLSVTYTAPVTTCTSHEQCDDGLYCNGVETCNFGTSLCVAGTPPDCTDAVACTLDTCNETSDACENVPDNTTCDDSNVCTDNVCNPTAGCTYPNNTASCSDGNACTTGDVCAGGSCVSGGAADCDDDVACTDDSCDTLNGCQHADNCTGGLVCNLSSGFCEVSLVPTLPIDVGVTWAYFKGSVEPPAEWTTIAFDDSGWLEGPSGFGYGSDCSAQHTTPNGTTLSDMQNGYLSVYLRREFRVDNTAAVLGLTLTADFDDSFVAYINGIEVARRNLTGTPPAYNQVATADHECSVCDGTCNAAENIDITAFKSALVVGTNVLAIQAHNLTLASTDFTITPSMTATMAECTGDADCNDNVACTDDSCVGFACQHVDNCSGGLSCDLGTGMCIAGPVTKTFQFGDANGYGGTADTFIDAALGSQATTTPIVVDGSPEEHVLVRFADIFGPGVNQVPQGAAISSATLTLRVGSTDGDRSATAVNYHRLLHAWVDTDVWAAYGVAPWNGQGGIQADGVDAVTVAEATVTMGAENTPYPVDVTGSVQAWANDPSSNFGWVILPTGQDGLRLASSESTTVAYRPQLSITYTAPITSCTSNEQCNDGLYCNGVETCNLGTELCEAGTPPCSDALACTADTCDEGTDTCSHEALVCNDDNACTDDACVEPTGCAFTNVAAGTSCADGLFCNGAETCNGSGACQAGASPCDDGVGCTTDSCDEGADTCSHAPCAMAAAAAGSRYIAVTPPSGLASVALRVSTPGLACLPQYVDATGGLTAVPVFRSSAEWGTVLVRGRPIVPLTPYTVQAEVTAGTPIATAAATTWAWADVNGTDGVNVFDILCVLDGSRGIFTKCPLAAVDLAGDTPDGIVDGADIQSVLDGFQSLPYPDADPCAGNGR